ncbi:aminotransferase class I/II-fold pyridoxal phosphate-dependent enzyme [Aminipila terrae]|uniref:Aminotransferase class V-fold PLP-dependent enzyme n=1 Tax=Aminipila terrae TaxID=2697030 RepID=A0A6P1MKJ7_9FIRM|nr:DegT/DnrJ/EryC1/StrS family aminotransferase [Aminipila terrae]QHI73194.1 aminotransferase class V-fold PLP-dependent enzyme [Aminipila terrae]
MNNQNGITSFLLQHRESKPVSFHMPGHKGADIYRRFGYDQFLENMMDCDVTEIHGADNLFQAESIIKCAMEKYRELYEVRKSYLLVNGTSCGLIAAIMSSVKSEGRLIMARNCHKSIFNALTLGNISPIYAYPELIEEFGISGEILPEEIERLIKENPDAEAVIIPSPNYYGICSDIKSIGKIVHDAGKILIVDQAHGAHLKFFSRFLCDEKDTDNQWYSLPESAEECGADIVVNSIHKTLASFTQSAVMNVVTDKIDLNVLEDKLQLVESTSPSYLLMSSLDINADLLNSRGKDLIREWWSNVTSFYKEAKNINGLKIINTGINMDWTKINLDMSQCGIAGHKLEQLLMDKNIFTELVTGNIVMCMTGIGNVKQDFDRLLCALREISSQNNERQKKETSGADDHLAELAKAIPKQESLHALPKNKQCVSLEVSVGRICASSIIPYPPGIPLICPGEIITEEAVHYIEALRDSGEKVMGINEENQVVVGM